MDLLFYLLFITVVIGFEFLFITYYFETIQHQWFHFIVFLRCTFVVVLWISHFGTQGYGVEWTYKGVENGMYLDKLGE